MGDAEDILPKFP